MAIALLTAASACVLTWALHHPVYRSQAQVLVNPSVTSGGTAVLPNMESEQEVVLSGVVTSSAAEATGTSVAQLQQNTSVTIPPDSTVLVIDHTSTTASGAQRAAQALAEAYASYRAPQAAIVSAATMPPSAIQPNYVLNGAAGLAVGLLLGIGSALLRDRLDDRVRGPRDLVQRTDLPLLATVPLTAADAASADDQPVVLAAPRSGTAEAYRMLRGKIHRAAQGGDAGPSVVLICSPARDDGAAHVAANTAAALALAGDKVLLVEADLRSPRWAEMFAVPADGGLGAVLAGRVAVADAVRTTRVPNLLVLPASTDIPSAPGELFDEEAVQAFLSAVPADVDHVVVVAPPVLRAAETSAVAAHAQLVVLVVSTGSTRREDVRAATRELADLPPRLLGGVLCQLDRGRRHRGDLDASGPAPSADAGPNGAPPGGGGNGARPPEDHTRVPRAGQPGARHPE
ncbi:AAA family ATPase [Geodermatophilus ruber]|uniref:AAA family ATPase n=1 Tax=Geodermatophilus ruber TaxID=504800 RepID=UPI0015A690B6|nr:AAA family ATPase [Geodermatophilus ruber]